jgi:branched-chain amino acid transport system substrate-binding protein
MACLVFAGGKADNAKGIVIGGILPLSGDQSIFGVDALMGIELALEEVNAAGGIGGQKLVFVVEDDEGIPEKTVSAFKKLRSRNKVKIIIGSTPSQCTLAIGPLAQEQKVVLLTPSGSAEAITAAGDYVFRTGLIDPFQGAVGGIFASEDIGAKTAAVLYNRDLTYSTGLMESFAASFKSMGGTVVASESYAAGDMDFSVQIARIKAANPGVVYLPDYYQRAPLIARQLRAQGIDVPLVGVDGWEGFQQTAGDEMLHCFFTDNFTADSIAPRVVKFVADFRAKYGVPPSAESALSYDSLYLIRDAMVSAGSTDSAAVRDALARTSSSYVTGNIRFDARRNPTKSAVVLEIVRGRDGKLTTAYRATVNL